MTYFKCLPWIIFAIVSCVNSEISLRTSLDNGTRVCPGQEITFTCETIGSSQLIWSSDQYIGTGGAQLQFFLRDTPGLVASSTINSDVFATLISADAQSQRIVSTLHIIASSDMSNPSVMCVHSTDMTNKTFRFQYLGIPSPPIPEAIEIQDEKNCIVFVEWNRPMNADESDITVYEIQFLSGNLNTTVSSVQFLVRLPDCTQDIKVRLRAVNRCGNVSDYSRIINASRIDSRGDVTEGANSTPLIVGTAVGSFVLAITSIVMIITLIVILYMLRRRSKRTRPFDEDKVKLVEATLEDAFVYEIQDDLEELYVSLKSLPVNEIRAAARALSRNLKKESSKKNIKAALKITLEQIQLESGEDVQTALNKMKSMIPAGSIDEKFEEHVNRLCTEAGNGQHVEVLKDLIEEMDRREVQPDKIIVVLLKLCKKLQEKSQESKKTEKMYRFSGQWKGYYKQYGEKQKMPCTLIIDRDDNIAGRGEDISRFSISGKIEPDGTFKFNKQYEGPTQFHMVIYCGSVEWADQPVVRGKWNIDSIGDKFLLTVDNVGLEASVITLCYSSAKEVLDMDRNQKRRKIINELSEKISEDLSDEDLIKVVEAQSKVQTASELSPSYGISGGGEEYAVVDSSGFYQDPHHIDHETMPATGDLYAVSEKKPKKGSKKGPSDEELVAMYSIPDKSKRDQELTYAAIEVHGGAGGVHGGASSEYANVID